MSDPNDLLALSAEIDRLVRIYSRKAHAAQHPGEKPGVAFEPGKTTVAYAGRTFDEGEVAAAVRTTLDFWLTLGPEGEAFQRELAAFLGVKHSVLVNSGSSANLVAFAALTSHKIPVARRIRPGDEVITAAAGFPTTVAPIIQHGAVPVFIDNDPLTGNGRPDALEEAYRPGKTKAVMMAHTLGNPFDLEAVLAFCRKHDLWLVEDNCDALGSTYSMSETRARELKLAHLLLAAPGGPRLTAPTGSWGDLSTQSFYPPHHITMGEGGAVNIVSHPPLKAYVESFRDWGRDCWCESGKDNTCGKRFDWKLGELPRGYDHKYIYSHLGYNLKPLDPQAAIGREQLKKLPQFAAARRRNWRRLRDGLADREEFFEFMRPTPNSDPSWFGFMLLVREDAPFTAVQLSRHLDERKVGNRRLFGGNLIRQPAFIELRRERPGAFRTIGNLAGADRLMNSALFVGVYPGLTEAMLDYVVEVIRNFAP
ncbi:MAG TPA: lipopolysaccharide biosynthesis protein RfbH [Opitutaceae bacterium]|nr:lipopolysaccharide biosynthesis protein RfbH [Opitutaceae bacterium]